MKARFTKHYVLGFLFTPDLDGVILIQKSRPAWQAGRFNGLGGKVAPGELPAAAMTREAQEEFPLSAVPLDWRQFGEFFGLVDVASPEHSYCVHCFTAQLRSMNDLWQNPTASAPAAPLFTTDEGRIWLVNPNQLPEESLSNVAWLVAMAREHLAGRSTTYFRIEEK